MFESHSRKQKAMRVLARTVVPRYLLSSSPQATVFRTWLGDTHEISFTDDEVTRLLNLLDRSESHPDDNDQEDEEEELEEESESDDSGSDDIEEQDSESGDDE